jgi:hypothetical protein
MMSRSRTLGRSLAVALTLGVIAASGAACKQGEGEVCQINADCQDGLTCNAGTQRCQAAGTSTTPDAGRRIDAGTADAAPADAAPADAATDAAVDAAP